MTVRPAAIILLGALVACSRTRGNDRPGEGPGPGPALGEDGGLACPVTCDDGIFCNGAERCDGRTGTCVAGSPERCDDDDECTLDSCDPDADRCENTMTPRDGDSDGWDACAGDCDDEDPEVHPGAVEVCDQVDQDCDGPSDEGLLSECGDCRPGCRLLHVPPRGEPWTPTEDNSDAVSAGGDEGDTLVLDASMSRRFDAWIANTDDGKVTRLDTRDGRQLAQYDSVLHDGSNGAPSPETPCEQNGDNGGNCPSRTAVDLEGAVYVANRAFRRQGTVTKIAGFEGDCVDRNGDGEIQTSRDLDENGQIDRFAEGEFLGQADECLLWTVDVGGDNSVPRAIAVAADGHVWVGLFQEQRVLELDPDDGSTLRSVSLAGVRPYGAAIDSRGRLWVVEALSGHLISIDTASGRVGPSRTAPAMNDDCPSSYGIAIDAEDRVWTPGFSCAFAFRYDPSQDEWLSVPLPDSGVTRGIAADDKGRIFVASSHAWVMLTLDPVFGYLEMSDPIARLTVFDAEDGGNLRVFGSAADPLPGGGSIGVGLDHEGRAWLINRQSGSATRVDTDSGEVQHFGVGPSPYTYSDFTGFALRRITAPSGFYRDVLEGCQAGPSEWEKIWFDAELPSQARVELRVRSASSIDELKDAEWSDRLPGVPPLRFLEVEARLVSGDRRTSPSLHEITVQLHCPT